MKMLKTKHFRRIVVFLAMIAPAVYLFGSLFAGLAGAHGEQVFADSPRGDYSEYVEVSSVDVTGSYKFVFDIDFVPTSNDVNNRLTFTSNGVDCDVFDLYTNGYVYYRRSSDQSFITARYQSLVWASEEYRTIYFDVDALPFSFSDIYSYGTLYYLKDFYADNQFSDYVFGQFFAKDNFLEQIGKDLLSDNPHGFVPFAAFWKYLDTYMLHMGHMQIGLMGYGYVYYCCHVLLFDIAFILVTFFLDFIQKVNDKIVGGVD